MLGLTVSALAMYMAAATASGTGQPDSARMVVSCWLLAASASTAIALVQYFGSAEPFAGWISAAAGEAYANLRQRNQFASLTVIGMAPLLWLLPRSSAALACRFAAMCWLAFGNAATTSRTGLMEMLVLGVLACAWPGPRRERASSGWWPAGLCVGRVALPLAAGGRPRPRRQPAVGPRGRGASLQQPPGAVVQRAAPDRAEALAGLGLGRARLRALRPPLRGPRFCDILDNAHNLPLHLAVELGLPAALLRLRRRCCGRARRQALARSRCRRGNWPGPCWR